MTHDKEASRRDLPGCRDHDPDYLDAGFDAHDFERRDEKDDAIFYQRDRFVNHLDETALTTVEEIIGQLVIEESPAILDLMASWNSHLPEGLEPSRVVGLGMNRNELEKNPRLTETVIHDLNRDPVLPFPSESFDAVINTVSVDYLTRPLEVFAEVARVLRPGGLHLVIFSNRLFTTKAVKCWRDAGDEERIDLVKRYFRHGGDFGDPETVRSLGRARPAGDRFSDLGVPSDPIYAVYADRKGGAEGSRPKVRLEDPRRLDPEELDRRKRAVKDTLCCPYCGEKLTKYEVPEHPFTQWDTEFMYVCFNNACPYFTRSWSTMHSQGNLGMSYRLMYNPDNDRCMATPIPCPGDIRSGLRG